jgi:hypothetical protein
MDVRSSHQGLNEGLIWSRRHLEDGEGQRELNAGSAQCGKNGHGSDRPCARPSVAGRAVCGPSVS